MFADNSSFGVLAVLLVLVLAFVEETASRVKRSEIALSWMRDGRTMCASCSRTLGSWMPSTESAVRTRTGMSCVTTASLSLPLPSSGSSRNASVPNGSGCCAEDRNPFADVPLVMVDVRIVRDNTGTPSFLVSRIEADEAFTADFSAR